MKYLAWFVLAAAIGLVSGSLLPAAQWQVGLARVEITPREPTWLAGYASRNHPAEGTVHPLWAKALALSDAEGNRLVIVTCDLIGLTREVGKQVAEGVRDSGLQRHQLLLSATHTHSGPVVVRCADIAHRMDEQALAVAQAYREQLASKLIEVVRQACAAQRPARLYFAQSRAGFAMNRRLPQEGKILLRPYPEGPVDHAVPMLVVKGEDGRLLAVLFGYACHNTTLGGDFYLYNGDYAGFAQLELEGKHPGAAAMFIAGCGADANPEPRGTLELAKQHGQALAAAVETALSGPVQELQGPLRSGFTRVELELVDPPDRETLQQWAASTNIDQQRLGKNLLHRLEKDGKLPSSYPCPVQVVWFGDDLLLVALGGEVVVDYALRLKRELQDSLKSTPLWTAAYCHEVFGYVPSERVLAEGGYEAVFSQTYYGFHGPYKPGLEERLITAIKRLATQSRP